MSARHEAVAEAVQTFAGRARYYRLSGHYEVTPDELEVIMAQVVAALFPQRDEHPHPLQHGRIHPEFAEQPTVEQQRHDAQQVDQ